MNNFVIELFERGLKAAFYTIHFEHQEKSETAHFLENFVLTHRESIEIIVQEIIRMKDKRGANYNLFRSEGANFLIALPQAKNHELRLYCIWINSEIVILGNGGIKKVRTYQEDPTLKKIAQMLQKVNFLVTQRLENKSIWIENTALKGNLSFKLSENYE